MYVNTCCNSRRQKCHQEKTLKILNNINTWYLESKNKSNTSNVRGNWMDVGIIQKIPVLRTGTAGHQRTTKNSHLGHCTHTAESADIRVQNTEHAEQHYMYSTINCNNRTAATLQNTEHADQHYMYSTINCNNRTAATVQALETWFVSDTELYKVYECNKQ
jgi:hypothetical protein